MKKTITATLLMMSICSTYNIAEAQTNFSGSWAESELEMISGKQYSNAVPKQITVVQTKDSIKITTIENTDNGTPYTQSLALNGKTISRVGKTSKRTIQATATWSNNGKTLTIVTLYSYTDNPGKTEYTNTEAWELTAEGNLKIEKTSDADVTDDWTIKAVYSKG